MSNLLPFSSRIPSSSSSSGSTSKIISSASLYIGTCDCRPVRLKSSSIKSSDTSAKYSCPSSEQNDDIHDSGAADSESDIALVLYDAEMVVDVPCEASVRSFTPANVGSVVADRIVAWLFTRTEPGNGGRGLKRSPSYSYETSRTLAAFRSLLLV